MSTDDRTPDAREVRAMYDAGSNLYRETPEQHYLGAPAPDYGAEFDRFLARVKRDAWQEGYEQGAEDGITSEQLQVGIDLGGFARPARTNPYREGEQT